MTDVIVIGAGLAGLSASIRAAQAGRRVTLLTFGLGGLQLGQGTIDVLGYTTSGETGAGGSGPGPDRPVARPFDQLPGYVRAHRDHPYAHFSVDQVREAVDWLAGLTPDLLVPGDGANHVVPTALGAMRPTYLVQPSMVWPDPTSVAVVGPRQIKDFYPDLAAANLEKTAQVRTKGYHIDLPARPGEVDSSPVAYASSLDDPAFLKRFAELVAQAIGDEQAVCLPAILGLRRTDAWRQLSEILGRPVVETLLAPPSIPGMRLNEALTTQAKAAGVRVVLGSQVTGFESDGRVITAVTLRQAGRDQNFPASQIIYAPGGFESGALTMDSYGHVHETLFDLPLVGAEQKDLLTGDYWADQKLFTVGVGVDDSMRPVSADKQPVYQNLRVAGGLLPGAIRWTEKSGDAIAVTSALAAVDAVFATSAPQGGTN
ncbi:MAG: glycerol-3-phosphate dehydrogenase subunit GlpB [Propionibacteriaceae bacterium]|jgi:glycerol-3-phosphate dehydrogenase subunit B|nr:glycerol-3-phosphate dehydrogenase subunit GlpB [Propionibacteriaceae bacterium]